uniref:NADP-dependent oxidoreductase domain-containing protein n=1 Tax=Hordeum vulgare subsp. vulgare TaxID=112509 RepID=A0A8I6XME2_HORVV
MAPEMRPQPSSMTFGEQSTEKESHDMLSYSLDQGINMLDTAEIYPIQPKEETQGRTDLYIACLNGVTETWYLPTLHSVSNQVQYIGVSNETSYGVMRFVQAAKLHGLPKIVSIQNGYSLLVRCSFEVDLAEVCHPNNCNIGLLAYSPLGSGVLTGKYLDDSCGNSKSFRLNLFPGYMQRYNALLAKEATKEYLKVAKKHVLTPVQLALGFVRDRPFTASTIIGVTTMDQLKENINAFTSAPRPLPPQVLDDIETVFKRYRDPAVL